MLDGIVLLWLRKADEKNFLYKSIGFSRTCRSINCYISFIFIHVVKADPKLRFSDFTKYFPILFFRKNGNFLVVRKNVLFLQPQNEM